MVTRDERAKGRTGYPEPNVDVEDTGVITPGGAYRRDGSVRDPRTPSTDVKSGAGPVGERGDDGPKRPAVTPIDHKDALERVRGKSHRED